jgi:hypothetical protein
MDRLIDNLRRKGDRMKPMKSQLSLKWWIVAMCFPALAWMASAQSTGAITGLIRTETGAPAAGVRVAAMAASSAPGGTTLYGIAQTGPDGRYTLEGIPAGRYYIVAGPVQSPIYHPGVDSSANATIVTVGSTLVPNMDFTANSSRLTTPRPPAVVAQPAQARGQNCTAAGAAAPTQPVAATDFVQVERTTCFGSCPQYSVRISGDGTVVWNGAQYVQVMGPATATVSPEKARALIERYRADGIYGLCDRYAVNTDLPSVISTVRIAGQEKRVQNGSPLADLEKEVERLADAHRWLHGDPLTEVIDFRNLETDSYTGIKPGITPLMQASSRRGTASGVSALLTSKADPNAQDASGWTALMYAALANDASTVKALLEGGADPRLRSHSGWTPLMAQVAVASIVSRDPIPAIRLLLAAGDDINATDRAGQTALMMTMARSLNIERDDTSPRAMARVNLAAFLRDSGARADIRDAAGKTALDLLKEEAARVPHPKAQFEKLRMILEQPQATSPSAPAPFRATVRPSGTDLESITLQRAGADPVRITAAVGPGGAVEFPAAIPGVYTLTMTPPPAFPVYASPVTISNKADPNAEIVVPAMRQVRVRVQVQGGDPPPVFWLLLASGSGATNQVNASNNRPNVQQLPAAMMAALSAGARQQLLQLGGPVNLNVTSPVRNSLPVTPDGQPVELPAAADGAYRLTLAEGEYAVAAILAPGGRSYPVSAGPVVTADMFSITAFSGGVDLASQQLRVSGSGMEIQVTFTPKGR